MKSIAQDLIKQSEQLKKESEAYKNSDKYERTKLQIKKKRGGSKKK